MREEVAVTETGCLPGYEEWLDRLSSTYHAVSYCCLHRLKDRAAAECVGVEVVAEMLARPRVFGYYGLPFSGQIGRLAEPRISRAMQQTPAGGESGWPELVTRLRSIPLEDQTVFLLACIEGCSDAEMAAELGCDESTAKIRKERTLGLLREVSESIVPPDRREDVGGDAH